jgi:hypothetical protein
VPIKESIGGQPLTFYFRPFARRGRSKDKHAAGFSQHGRCHLSTSPQPVGHAIVAHIGRLAAARPAAAHLLQQLALLEANVQMEVRSLVRRM